MVVRDWSSIELCSRVKEGRGGKEEKLLLFLGRPEIVRQNTEEMGRLTPGGKSSKKSVNVGRVDDALGRGNRTLPLGGKEPGEGGKHFCGDWAPEKEGGMGMHRRRGELGKGENLDSIVPD